MTITAKFPGRCSACSGAIAVGAKIEWSKGQPARHIACASSPARAAAPTDHQRRGTWTGCRCGSVEEYARAGDCSSCAHDRY